MTCEKRHPIWIFSQARKSCRAQESAHIIIFFSFETTPQPVTEQKKETPTRKKKRVILYLLRALVVAKEKRDERDARKSSFSSYSSPFTVLARCHASFRHGFFERVSERNFKSSRVSNVSVRFICLSSSPFLVLRASSCARDVLFLRAFSLSLSLSLSLKTETKDAL